jgi:hypothetical protein
VSDLHSISAGLVPFQEGEKVAFREDHTDHPGMYGVIQALGLDDNGDLAFDLAVHDPATGATDEDTIYRAKMGDIQ